MNRINILDCTLRDGGYCNNWNFGFDNIKKIVNNLQESKIDIIECGFLTDSFKNHPPFSFSKFNLVSSLPS